MIDWKALLSFSLFPVLELGLAIVLALYFHTTIKWYRPSSWRSYFAYILAAGSAGAGGALFLVFFDISTPTFFLGSTAETWIFMVICAPVSEEFLFRGAISGILEDKGHSQNYVWGVTSIVFGFGHLVGLLLPGGPEFVNFFILQALFAGVLGCLLAKSKKESGALLLPILSHAACNFSFLIAMTLAARVGTV